MNLETIKQIEEELKNVTQKLENAKQEMVSEHCNVNIGDIVTVNGYSYEGKQMVVKSIKFINNSFRFRNRVGFVCEGNVLKKDGTECLNWGECWIDLEDC